MTPLLVLPIEPVAWQRVKRGAYGQAYVPIKTRLFKHMVGLLAKALIDCALSGPVAIEVWFYLDRPKRPKHKVYPIAKPDLDNYFKGFSDALLEIAYQDDAQIVEAHTYKRYAQPGTEPRIEFRAGVLE